MTHSPIFMKYSIYSCGFTKIETAREDAIRIMEQEYNDRRHAHSHNYSTVCSYSSNSWRSTRFHI